jgi:hypothetical protein
VPPEEDHPLGRKAMEEILRSALREHVPLNYTTARLTSMHEVIITEYKAVNSANAKEIALNQNINTGLFKVSISVSVQSNPISLYNSSSQRSGRMSNWLSFLEVLLLLALRERWYSELISPSPLPQAPGKRKSRRTPHTACCSESVVHGGL